VAPLYEVDLSKLWKLNEGEKWGEKEKKKRKLSCNYWVFF